MAVPVWPSSLPLRPRSQSLSGGPRRMVASFEPEQGVEQTRPRVTAAIHVLSFETPALNAAQMVTLRSFFEDTLRGGSIPFSWLDPRTNDVWLWKPVPGDGPYKETDLGGGFSQVSLTLVRQPGRPWWAPYMQPDDMTPPLLVMDFQNGRYGRNGDAETFDAVGTLTRASTGTFVGSNGLVQTAGVNVARTDADGLIIEPARTNWVLRSEEFDNATWTKALTTVVANIAAAPDGLTTADRLVPTAVVGDHITSQTFAGITTGQAYTASCWLKASGYGWARISLGTSFATNYVFVDLATGAVGLNSGATSIVVTAFANGWWRLSYSVTSNATGNGVFQIYAVNANSFTTFAGDGTSGILAWGAEVKLGALSAYVPTAGATAVRAAETPAIDQAIASCDLRVTGRTGTVTTLLGTSIAAGSWPAAAANGARSIIAYPTGTL